MGVAVAAAVSALQIWVVYEHPSDYPAHYVARRHDVGTDGSMPTRSICTSASLEGLRALLRAMGLRMLWPREARDDPVIVETWL